MLSWCGAVLNQKATWREPWYRASALTQARREAQHSETRLLDMPRARHSTVGTEYDSDEEEEVGGEEKEDETDSLEISEEESEEVGFTAIEHRAVFLAMLL